MLAWVSVFFRVERVMHKKRSKNRIMGNTDDISQTLNPVPSTTRFCFMITRGNRRKEPVRAVPKRYILSWILKNNQTLRNGYFQKNRFCSRYS